MKGFRNPTSKYWKPLASARPECLWSCVWSCRTGRTVYVMTVEQMMLFFLQRVSSRVASAPYTQVCVHMDEKDGLRT